MTHARFVGSFTSQPKALYVLSFAELWERFSYYGIRALLMFYMISELGFSDAEAYGIYGMYFALASASSLAGGYIADHYLGNQKAIYLGAIIIIFGHLILLLPFRSLLNFGLAFVITGTGFFKANITSLLGHYYQSRDPRRDSGFTIFYMGINLGAFLAPFVCGYVGKTFGWNYGFGFSGLGMLLGLLTFYLSRKVLGNVGCVIDDSKLYNRTSLGLSPYHIIIIGTLLSIPVFAACIHYHELAKNVLYGCGIVVLISLVTIAWRCRGEERKALWVLITMMPFFVAFWASFEQAGASINLFIDRHVDRAFMGYEIPTPWFLSLTPFFIIILGSIFSMLWIQLGKRHLEPNTSIKFSLAFFQASLSFLFLKLGVEEGMKVGTTSMVWVVLYYLFRTTSELCIAPIALSMVTKLALPRLTSFMMGAFFLSIAFAQIAAQQVAKYFTTAACEMKEVAHLQDKAISLSIFGQIFEFLIILPLVAGIGMLLISPLVKNVFKKYG
ncbi:MAG: peptide MFS transporter [Candidatus Paracaedibacter sp.]